MFNRGDGGNERGRNCRLPNASAMKSTAWLQGLLLLTVLLIWLSIAHADTTSPALPGNQAQHQTPAGEPVLSMAMVTAGVAGALSTIALLQIPVSIAQRRRLRRAENLLAMKGDVLALLSSATTLGIWDWNLETKQVWASAQARSVLGLNENTPLTGADLLATIHPADRARVLNVVESPEHSNDKTDMQIRLFRRTGEIRWITWKERTCRDANVTVRRVLGYVVDDCERKEAAAEFLRQRQQLTHLTRVAILGELSGALAHELQQPLTSILFNAQTAQHLLNREKSNFAQVHEMLQDIVSADQRAGEIIERLRALLVRGETYIQRVEIPDLLRDVLTVVRGTLLQCNVKLVTHIDAMIPPIRGDRVELQQVLLNLIYNSCESMSNNARNDRSIEVAAAREDEHGSIRISVLDHGKGIEPDQLARVFDPYFTTKEGGLGLGLAICRSIVSAHRGKLWATNNAGRGAAFHLTVPRYPTGEASEHSTASSVYSR
jgi:C4-dicarboxylate-specific signal transduction histidine kinase